MKKKRAVYQGTFDPFTVGHLSVLENALNLFDEVTVLLLVNPNKTPLFSVKERKSMICAATAHMPGVQVEASDGLLVEYMQKQGLTCCVRGLRNGQDAEWELENHRLSRGIYPALQTILLPCEASLQEVSSSAVKEACSAGQLPGNWVPLAVQEALLGKYPNLVIF